MEYEEKHTCDMQELRVGKEVYFLRWSIVGALILEKGVMLGVLSYQCNSTSTMRYAV